jgi:hypothetical protein
VKPAEAGDCFHGFLKRSPTSLPVLRSKEQKVCFAAGELWFFST